MFGINYDPMFATLLMLAANAATGLDKEGDRGRVLREPILTINQNQAAKISHNLIRRAELSLSTAAHEVLQQISRNGDGKLTNQTENRVHKHAARPGVSRIAAVLSSVGNTNSQAKKPMPQNDQPPTPT